MKTILLMPLMVSCSILVAQNNNLNYQNALKVYNQTSLSTYSNTSFTQDTTLLQTTNTTTFQLLQPTIAYQWKSGSRNFHEVELTALRYNSANKQTEVINDSSINQVESGNTIQQIAISARYEYIIIFKQSNTSKWSPSIGVSVQPFFEKSSYLPQISTDFPTTTTYAGIRSYIIPRLNYFIGEKIFLDINIPLCLSDFYYAAENNENPGLTAEQRNSGTSNFRLLPEIYAARIGIGIKI